MHWLAWFVAAVLVAALVCAGFYLYRHRVYYSRPHDDMLLQDIEARGKPQVVFTMTTIPSRQHLVTGVIKDLLKQTIFGPRDRIVVNLPEFSEREHCAYDVSKMDEWRQLDPRITVNTSEDQGPLTRFLDTLRVVEDPNARIFPVDDDCLYPSNYFEELLWYSVADPDKVYGYHGLFVNNKGHYRAAKQYHGHVQVVESAAGAVYQRKMLDDSLFEAVGQDDPCHTADDVVLSAHVAKNGYERFLLASGEDSGRERGRAGNQMVHQAADMPLKEQNIDPGAVMGFVSGGNTFKCLKCHDVLHSSWSW